MKALYSLGHLVVSASAKGDQILHLVSPAGTGELRCALRQRIPFRKVGLHVYFSVIEDADILWSLRGESPGDPVYARERARRRSATFPHLGS